METIYESKYTRTQLDEGVGAGFVPTLQAAPTSSTTSYTRSDLPSGSQTVSFVVGQMCRVAVTGGYDFYQLKDVASGTATWIKVEFTDTTYESKQAASGGSDVSLVTTGEKYTWNNKQGSVAKLGSTTKPVYTSAAGTFAECSTYAGGTAVTLNGSSKAASTASFYAPTGAGTNGQYLMSSGSGAPTWTTLSTTDTKVTQTNSTGANNYNVLFSYSTATTTEKTEGSRKSANLQFKPSTGCLTTKSVAHTPYTGYFSSGALSINATNGDLQIFIPYSTTGDISGITISNAVAGQCITVILHNLAIGTATRSITIANSSTYICPNNENISLSLPQGCYCEISFLAKSSSEFFVRAI